jgi:transcriptional regulator with XRE-family HTH domain
MAKYRYFYEFNSFHLGIKSFAKGGDLKMKIRQMRSNKGITMETLAGKINTTKATISRWETGTRMPNPEEIKQLATILECSTDELLGFDSINPTRPRPKPGKAKVPA